MRHFRITFFRLETSFLERDINEKFWKKFQIFLYVASISGINFKCFHWFFNEWKNNNEIAGIPDIKMEYLAHTNWSKKSASGFLFCEPMTTRIGSWSRFCDRPDFSVTLCSRTGMSAGGRTACNLLNAVFTWSTGPKKNDRIVRVRLSG